MTNKFRLADKTRLLFAVIPLILILMFSGCAVEPTLREGSEGGYVRLPFVNVLLDESLSEITLDGEGTYSIECVTRGENIVYKVSNPIIVRNDHGLLKLWIKGAQVTDNYTELFVIPDSRKGLLKLNNRPYRGMFQVMPRGGNIRVINSVHVDDYLKGVVPTEIGGVGDDAIEAVKAQAVAARTYALSHIGQYSGEPYDLKADVSDQVYNGIEVERNLISKAIDATRGYVIMYHDKMINAYYHSTCGGLTDEIHEVWEKAEMPYLKSVFDKDYCQWSKYFTWEETYTTEQLKMRIEQYLSADRGREVRIGDVTDIAILKRTAGGRVADLMVSTTNGTYHFGKDKIRWVFRRSTNPNLILQSARFNVVPHRDSGERLRSVDFIGGGYGHGVGMCQCGAIGRSRAGEKYADILKYYYSGVDLVKLY